jgi:hypothetical protein
MANFESIDDYVTRCLVDLEVANNYKFYERPFDKYDNAFGPKSLEMQAQIKQLPAIPNNPETIQNHIQNMMTDLDAVIEKNKNNIPADKQEGFVQRLREGYVFSSLTKLFNHMHEKFGAKAAKDFQKFANGISKKYIAEKYSPKIDIKMDAGFFAGQQLSGISVLTDPNAEAMRKLIVNVAKEQFFDNIWQFLQDIQKLNAEGYTREQFNTFVEKYVKSNDINVDAILKKKILDEAAKAEPSIAVLQPAVNIVFGEFFVRNKNVMDVTSPQNIASVLHSIASNKELEKAPLDEWKKILGTVKAALDQIAEKKTGLTQQKAGMDENDPAKAAIDKKLQALETKMRAIAVDPHRIETIVTVIENRQAMLAQYKEQQKEIITQAKTKVLTDDFESKPAITNIKGVAARITMQHEEKFHTYAKSNANKTDRVDTSQHAIAMAVDHQLKQLVTKLQTSTKPEERLQALTDFGAVVTKFIADNRSVVDFHNSTASIFTKKSYGDLEKHLNSLLDNKNALGLAIQTAQTAKSALDKVETTCKQPLAQLAAAKPATKPVAAVVAPVVAAPDPAPPERARGMGVSH